MVWRVDFTTPGWTRPASLEPVFLDDDTALKLADIEAARWSGLLDRLAKYDSGEPS